MGQQFPIKVIPIGGIDLDSDPTRMKSDKAVFIKNMTINQHEDGNSNNNTPEGGNFAVYTPLAGNVLVANQPAFPAGKNVCMGSYHSPETYECYVAVYNENLNHFIYVYGQFTPPTIVYKNPDLNFQLDPKYYLTEFRMWLETRWYTDADGVQKVYKFLFTTDNFNYQKCIEVNSSIATNSYDTALPYFDNTNNTYDRSKLINIGVLTPSECIAIESIPRDANADFEQNQMTNRMWQWRIMFKNRFGEISCYGIISDQYTPITGSGCVAGADGLPRCVKLTIEAGNPFVEWIEIDFRINDGDWKKYDTIQKYNNDTNVPWYQRPLSSDLVNYDATTNKFEYIFCGDKQWGILPQDETSRIENFLAKKSAAIFPLDLSLGFANNVHGFQPIRREQLEKVNITVTEPTGTCTDNPLRRVEVYAFILNHWQNVAMQPLGFSQGIVSETYQPTHAPTNAEYGDPDIWWGTKIFSIPGGGLAPDSSTYWGQFFRHGPGNNEGAPKNFTAFMAGTSFHSEAVQYIRDGSTECEVGAWNYTSPPSTCGIVNGIFVQKFVFKNLPPDKYVLRICDHRAEIDDLGDYQNTSTQVFGTTKMGGLINPGASFGGYSSNDKEIIIDCTAGDVILNGANDSCLVILDLAMNETPFTTSPGTRRTYDGYLNEDAVSDIPLERMLVNMPSPIGNTLFTPNTDHNGYWFGSWLVDDFTQSPTGDSAHPTHAEVDDCVNALHDINLHGIADLDPDGQQYSAGGFWFKLMSTVFTGMTQFPDAGRTHIVGGKYLCSDHGIGLVNFPIVVAGASFDKTDSSGKFDIIIHKWGGTYASSMINVIMSNFGACIVRNCNDMCDFDKPIFTTAQLACTGTSKTITIADEFYSIQGINLYGLQNGGLYQFCINAYDWLGRRMFAQTIDKYRVPIKSISETHVYAFSKIGFTIDASTVLPLEISYITFGVTPNLNFSSFFTWIVDQAQFVDSRGKTNNANPEYIRIYYSSLSEYNKNFDFKTNATWQLLAGEDVISTVAQNDQIEFIQKGQGGFFDKRIVVDVLYDSDGKFFTIKYLPELAFLMNKDIGPQTIIKFMRPRDFNENAPYFEICSKIQVINGVPQVLSGVLNAVDSYMYARRIPIPVALQAFGEYVTSGYSNNTSTPLKENDVIKFFDDTNELQINDVQFTPKFEHDSPSDFWGEKVNSHGRINVINPYEAEKRYKDEVALSKALSDFSNFNGLSYFSSDDAVYFNQESWGGIMAVFPDVNKVLFICEFQHFIAGYKESGTRTSDDGTIVATQNIGNFSIPMKREGQEFGCQEYFINTIKKHRGLVSWLDGERQAMVQCDYSSARDVSILNGYKSYINKKIEEHDAARKISQSVNTNPIFIGGINPRNQEYLLTYNKIPTVAGLPTINIQYNNNSLELTYTDFSDTAIVDLRTGALKSFVSFTPEYYTMVESLGNTLISLRQGKMWSHYNGNATPVYNNFFGAQQKKVIEVIFNKGIDRVKRWLFTQVYAKEHLMIADRIISETSQRSRILSAHWRQGEKFKQAPFLCDLNTIFQNADQPAMAPLAIVAGELLSGRWLKVRYISQNADDNKYIEISAFMATVLGLDKTDE